MIEKFGREIEKTYTGNEIASSEFIILSPDDLETKWKLGLFSNGNTLDHISGIYILEQGLKFCRPCCSISIPEGSKPSKERARIENR